jgi:hypothetical protein
MKTCKTCVHWTAPDANDYDEVCRPTDPDTYEPMVRGFETRYCRQPTQTFCEAPVERNGFGLKDGSTYAAEMFTAEDFGCVRHEEQSA